MRTDLGWFVHELEGFVFDPRLRNLQMLYLNFSTLHCRFLWRTNTIVFVKSNKSPSQAPWPLGV